MKIDAKRTQPADVQAPQRLESGPRQPTAPGTQPAQQQPPQAAAARRPAPVDQVQISPQARAREAQAQPKPKAKSETPPAKEEAKTPPAAPEKAPDADQQVEKEREVRAPEHAAERRQGAAQAQQQRIDLVA